MQNNAFQPYGSTFAVSSVNPVQVTTTNNQQATSYRVRNLTSGTQYLTWSPNTNTSAPPQISAVAPVLGTASPNTVGMIGNSVEIFVIPHNAWFVSTGAMEVTPGEGI
jgi:hypothetical protein